MICKYCNGILPEDSKFCQFCGRALNVNTVKAPVHPAAVPKNIQTKAVPVTPKQVWVPENDDEDGDEGFFGLEPGEILDFIMQLVHSVLCVVSVFAVILAVCFQDRLRNAYEMPDSTLCYFLLLELNIVALVLFLLKDKVSEKKTQNVLYILSMAVSGAAVIFISLGSVWSRGCYIDGYYTYVNGDIVNACNIIALIICIVCFVINVAALIKDVLFDVWHKKALQKKLNTIYGYYTAGIITKEELISAQKEITERSQSI